MLLSESHHRYFATADKLSKMQVDRMLGPLDVIRVLTKEKISFVLVGAYGLVGWTKTPRATQDVDVVVAARQVKKAVRGLQTAFPELEADDQQVVVRLKDRQTGNVVIDVMKPIQPPYTEIFKHTHTVEEKGIEYRVPSVEMALGCKFAPLVSLHRPLEKKLQDGADFVLIAKQNLDLDMEVLSEIGELVFPGGGKELVDKVHEAREGKHLTF